MGVGSNITPDYREDTRQCNITAFCDEASFLGEDLIQFAPCPPPWNKGLFWEVVGEKGLSDEETNEIVTRCVIPRPQEETVCGASCIAICIISGCLLITVCLAVLCWCRRRSMVIKRSRATDFTHTAQDTTRSKQVFTEPVHQGGHVHYSNIMAQAYDNKAYENNTDLTVGVDRSNSDISNNSHTNLNGSSKPANQNNSENDEGYEFL